MFQQSATTQDVTPAPASSPALPVGTKPDQAEPLKAPQNTGDPFLDHYFRRIDPQVAESFNTEQREAIKAMFGARGIARHSIELRRSLPIGRRRYYIVLLMGRERRTFGRLYSDGTITRSLNVLGYVITAALWMLPAIGAALLLQLLL